jgi:hypothetical protein
MAQRIRVTTARRTLRQIAVLIQASRLGRDPEVHRAVFASLRHMLDDPYRGDETVQALMSLEDHAAALAAAGQHRGRFGRAHATLMQAPEVHV